MTQTSLTRSDQFELFFSTRPNFDKRKTKKEKTRNSGKIRENGRDNYRRKSQKISIKLKKMSKKLKNLLSTRKALGKFWKYFEAKLIFGRLLLGQFLTYLWIFSTNVLTKYYWQLGLGREGPRTNVFTPKMSWAFGKGREVLTVLQAMLMVELLSHYNFICPVILIVKSSRITFSDNTSEIVNQ